MQRISILIPFESLSAMHHGRNPSAGASVESCEPCAHPCLYTAPYSDVRLRMAPTPGRRGRVPILFLLFGSAHAQFGNLEVKWQADASTGSKDARPSMGTPELMAKPDGKTRSTNLRSLTNERLEGIVTEFGLSCDLCTNAGHWISRVRSGGGCVGGESPPARTAQ